MKPTVNRILDYFRTPFNQTVERLKEAGAVENIPLDYVVYALNIPGINWHKADLLAARFDYIYELSVASAAEIRAVEGTMQMKPIALSVFSVLMKNWYGN